MMTALILTLGFSLLMIAIGVVASGRSRTYDQFLVAGRSHGVFSTTLSILATAIGASATVGLMDQTAAKGFPFFWFLGAAAIGLLVQGLTVAGAIRRTGARTFSEVVEKQFGPRVHRVISILIVLGWTAIVAAQFKAAGSLVEGMSAGRIGYQWGVILAAALIVFYTLPGGQQAVILTDVVQFAMVAAGILGLLIFLLIHAPFSGHLSLALFNDQFTAGDWLYHLLIVGGIYVISPNLFSRCFSARDESTARNAVLISAPVMALCGFIIAFIGVYAAASGAVQPGQPVFATLSAAAGYPWSILLGLSIFAAIVSSADTTLLVTASIAQHDLLRRESIAGVRSWVAGIAAAAVLLVLLAPGATLYTLLFAAYNVFAPAVVPLVFAAFYAPRRMEPVFVWSGLGIGMAAGLYGYTLPLIRYMGFTNSVWPERTVLTAGFCTVSLIAFWAVIRARKQSGLETAVPRR